VRPELLRLARLEAHLLGGPPPPDTAAAWHLARLTDAEWDADAAALQTTYAGLRAAGRRQLRHELRALHHQLYGPAASGRLARAWAELRRWLGRG
jgi:hypothetical protein